MHEKVLAGDSSNTALGILLAMGSRALLFRGSIGVVVLV
jgi:hypothetical protein